MCYVPAIRSNPHSRGFTLLELLVVLVLMGVILSIAVLSLGDGGRRDQLREEVRRVASLMTLAGEEALLNTLPYGVQFQREGYRFLRYRDGTWQQLEDDALLRAREWPEGIEAVLYQDGLEVELLEQAEQETDENGEPVEPRPALVFYPDGERTPFELELSYRTPPHLRHRIDGVPFGPLEYEALDAQ